MVLKQIGTIRLEFSALPEYDIDLSWDETGEVAAAIDSGQLEIFCARVQAIRECPHCGEDKILGEDYLGECIYSDFGEFIAGASAKARDYCRDMMRAALSDARQSATA